MKRNYKLKRFLNFSLYLLLVLVIAFLLVTFVIRRATVIGNSMETTLYNDDQLLLDKLSYRFHEPKRFDVVVFNQRYKVNSHIIKRIIGLPGDNVKIADSIVYINDKPINDRYAKEAVFESGLAKNGIVLGDDEYFVLGDNRNDSIDSRYSEIGNISKKDIEGKVIFRLYPISKMGTIK